MIQSWERRFAIFCAIFGVALIFLGVSISLVEGRIGAGSYPLIAGVALIVAYAVLDPSAIRDLVSSRQSRFGSLSVLITALVVGLLVMGNVLASRDTHALDLTRSHANTLAAKSVAVAQAADSDIQVILFFARGDPGLSDVQALLSRYQAASSHVKVAVVDPNSNPEQARALNVQVAQTVVIQYHGKTTLLNYGQQSEQEITAAVLKLESNQTPEVCWTIGDGERDLKDTASVQGYSEASQQIVKDNFTTRDLLLSQAETVPADCSVVVVMGPAKGLSEAGTRALTAYLAAGGKLLLALDPWLDATTTAKYNELLKPYALSFSGGLVVDPDAAHSASNDPTTPAVTQYGNSPIAKDLNNRVAFFPVSDAISGSGGSDETVVQVARSSDLSYLIQEPRQDLKKQAGKDKPGPLVLMATVEKTAAGTRKQRLVLIGSSSMGENRALAATVVNTQLLTGSLDWLAEQESLISIPPKAGRNPPLTLTQEQQNVNVFITMLLLPILVVAGGIIVWARRRH